MASPASTYSAVIDSSFLRPRLLGAVEAGLGRNFTPHDDGPGQPPPLVVSGRRAVPVVARSVQVELRRPPRMIHQPDEFLVTVARQQRAMRIVIVIDNLKFEITTVWHHQNRRIPRQFVRMDTNRRLHPPIGLLRGMGNVSGSQYLTDRCMILRVQPELS